MNADSASRRAGRNLRSPEHTSTAEAARHGDSLRRGSPALPEVALFPMVATEGRLVPAEVLLFQLVTPRGWVSFLFIFTSIFSLSDLFVFLYLACLPLSLSVVPAPFLAWK